jgi:hypothetical protein
MRLNHSAGDVECERNNKTYKQSVFPIFLFTLNKQNIYLITGYGHSFYMPSNFILQDEHLISGEGL